MGVKELSHGALGRPSRAERPSQEFSFLGSLNTFGTSGLLLEADIRQIGVHGRFAWWVQPIDATPSNLAR
jgi:hypothetical protein